MRQKRRIDLRNLQPPAMLPSNGGKGTQGDPKERDPGRRMVRKHLNSIIPDKRVEWISPNLLIAIRLADPEGPQGQPRQRRRVERRRDGNSS